MSSPEFERAAYQAEIQHAKNTDKKCQVRLDVDTKCNSENDDASAPLPASSPLTTQGRYFDMAIAEDFIIVNVHAESLNAGILRDKQFRAIVEHIRTVTTTNIPVYLCGDLNTTVGSAEEKVLLKYFTDTNSQRSVWLWASKLIQALWEFTSQVWGDRNSRLHDTEIIKDLEGRKQLEKAIRREWDTGLGNLPAAEFSYLLSGSLETILKRSLFSLRRWLAIVRNRRILLDAQNLITDKFMEDVALQRWIGITLPSDEDTDSQQDGET